MPASHRFRAVIANPFIAAFVVVFVFGAWSKLHVLPTLATNVDDIGVASVLLEARHARTSETIRAYSDSTHGVRSKLLHVMDRTGLLPVAVAIGRVAAVPQLFTYAPGQFPLTALLISDRQSYRVVVWRGRLPSFMFAVLATLLLALAMLALFGEQRWGGMLVAGTMMACSWELLIYSAQMQSYAVGAAGCALMVFSLARLAQRSPIRVTLGEATLMALLPWFQYQLLFLLPGYIAVRTWQVAGWPLDRRRAADSLLRFGIPALLSTAVLYHFFLGLHAKEGVSWNGGPHGEFLFHLPAPHALATTVVYAARFFTMNSANAFATMLAFVPPSNPAFRAVAVALLLVAAVGIASLARDRSTAARSIVLFSLIAALVWCALIVLGRIALSPTRHELVLLPLGAVYVAAGVCAIGRFLRAPVAVPFGAAVVCVIAFVLSYGPETAARRDVITETRMDSLIAATSPDLVIAYDCLWNLRLMPPVNRPVFDAGCVLGPSARWLTAAPSAPSRRVLLVNGGRPLTEPYYDSVRTLIESVPHGAGLLRTWKSYGAQQVLSDSGQRTLELREHTGLLNNGFYATLLTLSPAALP